MYLVDFGSVQTLAAKEDGTITVVGTYGYMPPEQFGGRTVPASDIYSLGATLIGLLTGTHPADLPQKDGCIQFARSVNISRNFASWLERTIQPSLDKRFPSARKALQVLSSPPQLQELQVVGKPLGSRVVVNKNADSLEILVPLIGFKTEILASIGVAIGCNLINFIAAIIILSLLPFPFRLLVILVDLPIIIMGMLMVREILWILFGQVQLILNHQQISLTYNLFDFKYSRSRPARREDITKLEYGKKSFKYNTEIPILHITIWAGRDKYELKNSPYFSQFGFDYDVLTKPELEWLAYELSDWLGMPIVKG